MKKYYLAYLDAVYPEIVLRNLCLHKKNHKIKDLRAIYVKYELMREIKYRMFGCKQSRRYMGKEI